MVDPGTSSKTDNLGNHQPIGRGDVPNCDFILQPITRDQLTVRIQSIFNRANLGGQQILDRAWPSQIATSNKEPNELVSNFQLSTKEYFKQLYTTKFLVLHQGKAWACRNTSQLQERIIYNVFPVSHDCHHSVCRECLGDQLSQVALVVRNPYHP